MNILWAHDHTFYYNESGKFYSGGKLPYQVWQRYLSIFDRMTVVGRGRKLPADADPAGKTLSSGPNVEFLIMPSLSNPINKWTKKGYVDRMLTDAILQVDAVIARMPSELGSEVIRIAKRYGKNRMPLRWWRAHGMDYGIMGTYKASCMRRLPFIRQDPWLVRLPSPYTLRIRFCSLDIHAPRDRLLAARMSRLRRRRTKCWNKGLQQSARWTRGVNSSSD